MESLLPQFFLVGYLNAAIGTLAELGVEPDISLGCLIEPHDSYYRHIKARDASFCSMLLHSCVSGI